MSVLADIRINGVRQSLSRIGARAGCAIGLAIIAATMNNMDLPSLDPDIS